jgi:hypothetical protein
MSTPYLEAEAAALGDREMSPRVPRPLSDTILEELDYTADLIQRADKAISAAIYRLEGSGVHVMGTASLSASAGLSQLGALLQIMAICTRAGRKA